jgi:uncharacterized protein YjiS (DUF1127 family)
MRTFASGSLSLPAQIQPRRSFGGILRAALGMLGEWRQRQYERAVLASLDDTALRDIGINRTDVWAEVNKPFWRP